jgi:hypothetical protein
MMHNLEQLEKLSSKVRLEPEKKAAMRTRLLSFIAAHEALKAEPAKVPFPWAQKFVLPASAFALLLIVGGGTSLAAEKALPGDALYAVKINVNEPLVTAFAPTEGAKAEWHATVALRRLEEADTLALQGKLTPEEKSKIEVSFETSATKAQATFASLDEKGDGSAEKADDLSIKFESSLKAHAEILARLGGDAIAPQTAALAAPSLQNAAIAGKRSSSTSETASQDSLVLKIRSTIAAIAAKHGETEAKITNGSDGSDAAHAAEGKIGAAKNVIDSVNDFLDKSSSRLGADAIAAARVRLDAAERLMTDASAKLDRKDYKNAFTLANQAIRKAQETRVLAAAQLQANTEGADAAVSASARAVNLLVPNPQDDTGNPGDHVIMNSVTLTVTSTPTSTLNVDGEHETETP